MVGPGLRRCPVARVGWRAGLAYWQRVASVQRAASASPEGAPPGARHGDSNPPGGQLCLGLLLAGGFFKPDEAKTQDLSEEETAEALRRRAVAPHQLQGLLSGG